MMKMTDIKYICFILICWITTALWIVTAAKAQPRVVVDPESFSFELSLGARDTDVLNVSNDGDEVLTLQISQGEPRRDVELEIMMWTRFADSNTELNNIRSSLRSLEIDYRLTEYGGVDPDEFTEYLFASHVLLIPEPQSASDQTITTMGRDMEDNLRSFMVEHRGFIVVLDFLGSGARFLSGARLLDLEVEEREFSFECEALGQHILNADVEEYRALRGSNLHTSFDDGAFVVTREVNGDGNHVTAKQFERGGLVYIGSDWLQYNTAMTKLLINSVLWTRGGANWLYFEQVVDSIAPRDFADLIFSINTNIIDQQGDFASDIILTTNDPDNQIVRVPVTLTISERLPPEFRLEPAELFMISGDVDTSYVISVHNPGNGWFEADVRLEDSNQNWLSINRSHISLGPGRRDRILLEFDPEEADPVVESNAIVFTYIGEDPVEAKLPVLYYTGDSFGAIEGRIYEAVDRIGIENAIVNLQGLKGSTDRAGNYRIGQVPPYYYHVDVSHPAYLDYFEPRIEVASRFITHFWASMLYATLETDLSPFVQVSVPPGSEVIIEGIIENTGSGDLEYQTHFTETSELQNIRPWQVLLNLSTAEITENQMVNGIEFNGEYFIVSATGNQNESNVIFLIDRNGGLVNQFDQPAGHILGMAGLAWDGEIVYGTGDHQIIGIDLDGRIRRRIRSPIRYNRAIAWDNINELIWVGYARNDIYALDLDGQIVHRIRNVDELQIYGLAYREDDPGGYNLWMFCHQGPFRSQILKANPESGEIRFVINLQSENNERAGGLALTNLWDGRRLSLIAQYNGGAARTTVYNLARSQGWVRFDPPAANVPSNDELDVALIFRSTVFPMDTELEGFFTIDGRQRGGEDTIRVKMIVSNNYIDSGEKESVIPSEMALSSYPNPFNRQLYLNYRSEVGSLTSLDLYDLRGRLVRQLIQDNRNISSGNVILNSVDLASGVYLVALSSGESRIIRKVVLLR